MTIFQVKFNTMKFILRWVLHLLLFILILETCARIEDWIRWDAPVLGNYSRDNLSIVDDKGRHGRSNGRYQKWVLNQWGFRGPDFSLKKPTGTTRVAIAGSSETFGLYESRDREFPAQLRALFNHEQGSDLKVEIINTAFVGMTLPRILHYYDVWIKQFQPDVFVVYPSPAFYLDVNAPKLRLEKKNSTAQKSPQLRISGKIKTQLKSFLPQRFQNFLRKMLIQKIENTHPEDWVWQQPPQDRLDLFREDLVKLIARLQTDGVKVVVMTHADRFSRSELSNEEKWHLIGWRKFYPKASLNCLLEMENECNQIAIEIANEQGASLLDLAKIIPKKPEYFADFAHFTNQGAAFVAREIYNLLRKNVLVVNRKTTLEHQNVLF